MTDDELKELVAATSRTIARREALSEKSEREWRQLREEMRASRTENDRVMRSVHREIGRLNRKFGDHTESLAGPALARVVRERFHMTEIAPRVQAFRNGSAIELDMLGHANDRINKVYVGEIKTKLREEGIEQILEHPEVFPEFFPHHRGKELYGIPAALEAPVEMQKRVLKEGIYLMLVSEDSFELREPEGFRPRNFATA